MQSSQVSTDELKSTLRECAEQLADIQRYSNEIIRQGGWEAYWSKSGNIRLLAHMQATTANVQKETLNMLLLMIASTKNVSKMYRAIVSEFGELRALYGELNEVRYFLNNIESTVKGLRNRNRLNSVFTFALILALVYYLISADVNAGTQLGAMVSNFFS